MECPPRGLENTQTGLDIVSWTAPSWKKRYGRYMMEHWMNHAFWSLFEKTNLQTLAVRMVRAPPAPTSWVMRTRFSNLAQACCIFAGVKALFFFALDIWCFGCICRRCVSPTLSWIHPVPYHSTVGSRQLQCTCAWRLSPQWLGGIARSRLLFKIQSQLEWM